ncbi:MAG TPA: hypothetical protein VGR57_10960 [Ktedonobacterales bacterium]|nr:hypothetical protein [Ktedonobacterales bacterium]
MSREHSRRGMNRLERQEDDLQLLVGAVGALLPGVLYLILPERFIAVGPPWLLLVIEALLVAPPIVARVVLNRPLPYALTRTMALMLLVVVTAALISSVGLLVGSLGNHALTGASLLRTAGLLWGVNIFSFALWYWEIDCGGPLHRLSAHATPDMPDFLFPQQVRPANQRWKPGFVDYIFLAFCFSTALSPADTMPLTRRAKLLMMAQAVLSALVLVILVGRSVNIL